jgi:hypothetical protein
MCHLRHHHIMLNAQFFLIHLTENRQQNACMTFYNNNLPRSLVHNLIKFRSLTCFSLLICRSEGDLRKSVIQQPQSSMPWQFWQSHIRVTNKTKSKSFLQKLDGHHNGLLIYTECSACYYRFVSNDKRVINGFEHGTLWAINGTWDANLSIITYGCPCQNCKLWCLMHKSS